MDLRIQNILDQISSACRAIFSGNLVGIYVHGSLALGCFNWDRSDIDFIIVTRTAPSLDEKVQFMETLLALDEHCPPKGLEMSLVLERYCKQFSYPTPFELHFSNSHKQACEENVREYCTRMNGTDKDLAAHFTIIKKAGMTLWGDTIGTVFGDVPMADYLDSIQGDIEGAVEDILENPVYIILNLCRVQAFIRDGAVLSKAQGGRWGLDQLPEPYAPVIDAALQSYSSAEPFPSHVGTAQLQAFATYMLEGIFTLHQ